MYNKFLTGIVIVLLTAIIGMLGYIGYGYYKKITLNADAKEFLEEFDTIVVNLSEQNNEEENLDGKDDNQNPSYSPSTSPGYTNQLYYKGFEVVGKIDIPAINIQYPVLGDATRAKAIEVSVIKIYGPNMNEPGNFVIAGHNYNNGLFFGRNKNLQIGDKIYITDMTGRKLEYTIYNKYYTPESDNSYITRITDGRTEVTLYTCDATGKNRLIICAVANQE